MQIALLNPTMLKVTYPLYPAETEAEVQRRLATVPGIERGKGRMAFAPIIQLQRLMQLFGKASIDYAAMQAADHAASTFYTSMVSMGVKLGFDASGGVCAISEVSDDVQRLIADRSHALAPFVRDALEQPALIPMPQPVGELSYPKRKSGTRKRGKA